MTSAAPSRPSGPTSTPTSTEACEKAGRPGLLFHDLRQSAVRNLERGAGILRSVAMKLTGHKTESVYRRYAIVAESDLKAAGEKLSTLLSDSVDKLGPYWDGGMRTPQRS